MPHLPSSPRWFQTANRLLSTLLLPCAAASAADRLNILFAIADDQSWPHTSAYGTAAVQTPAFDRLAEMGVLFNNAFAPAPQCSPCRAGILTGRNIWQLEEAGTHGSLFPAKFPVFTRILEADGYHVGYTGKAWSPGNWKDAGWKKNPVGTEYNEKRLRPPTAGISPVDYAENFRAFLAKREAGQPFFFWYGGHEPHRTYTFGSGQENGIASETVELPPFLPDTATTRTDVADYLHEIEWFDQHLGRMLSILEENGELENTLVIVTADNGMPFPHAKANLMEPGTHVPLVIAGGLPLRSRESEALVSLIDLAPTILDVAGLRLPESTPAKSLLPHLIDDSPHRRAVLTGRERHTHARPDNLGYPARAIRTADYLYIWNIKPDRWPAGDPPPETTGATSGPFKSVEDGYEDIDSSPSKSLLLQDRLAWPQHFQGAFEKRPAEQLFAIRSDPHCLKNLADDAHSLTLRELRAQLIEELRAQGDPRVHGTGDIFESYPRFGSMRSFPGFKERGAYNPAYQPAPTSPSLPD